MITKEDFLNAEFLKQFKDSKEFTTFMEELYVRGTEKILEAEIVILLSPSLFVLVKVMSSGTLK